MVRKEIYTRKICLNCWSFNYIDSNYNRTILNAWCRHKDGADLSTPPFRVNVKHNDVACKYFSNAGSNTIRGSISDLRKALGDEKKC